MHAPLLFEHRPSGFLASALRQVLVPRAEANSPASRVVVRVHAARIASEQPDSRDGLRGLRYGLAIEVVAAIFVYGVWRLVHLL